MGRFTKNYRTSIALLARERMALQSIADDEQTSISAIVRRAILEYIRRRRPDAPQPTEDLPSAAVEVPA